MYVCLCQGITDQQIRSAVRSGASSLHELRRGLGVASQCGKCNLQTREIIRETLSRAGNSEPLYYAASPCNC